MGSEGRRNDSPLSEQLFAEAYRFDFFQAVRVLERMARAPVRPDVPRLNPPLPRRDPPVGGDQSPKQEVVRFRSLPSHSFPPGSIREICPASRREADATPSPPEMTVALMGLFGPEGVLPQHYTTLVLDRVRFKDFTLRDFLDLFNHRTISLFYRAWEKYRFQIGYERAQPVAGEADEDVFTRSLYSLLGFGTAMLRRRMEFDDEALSYYAGYFVHFPRNAISLERMLADYLELPVELLQFHGQWLYLSGDDLSLLPGKQHPQGLNCKLGTNVVVGERVWDVEGKFRVRLGPLTYRDFHRFMPSGDRLRPLCQMIRTYCGPQFDFDAQLVLLRDEVPWCRLGGAGPDPSRLGWNTWIRAKPSTRNVDDAVFSVEV